ncbi:LPS translocon maturation chaperone LptM [Parasalinivibrio latis]|uniref:LPS translocon maturation chaperone LptM n=1 Tax=Parasalinivibrio latis TaxID=2952610 RepID=UPI003DA39F98
MFITGNTMRKCIFLMALLAGSTLLSGCGQQGPLYYPHEQPPQDQPQEQPQP